MWLTDNIKSKFSNVPKELNERISVISAVVYDNSEMAQPYIVSKHNGGIKEWSSEEKNFNYYRMFQNERERDTSKKIDEIINKITTNTNQKGRAKTTIKNAIKLYSLFNAVFNSLSNVQRNNIPHDNAFLPLVQVFMTSLSKELELSFDDENQCYSVPVERKDIFNHILALAGEAFLLRKPANQCKNDEKHRISNDEVDMNHWQEFLEKNERIPGLLALIKEYKETPIAMPKESIITAMQTEPVETQTTAVNDDNKSQNKAKETQDEIVYIRSTKSATQTNDRLSFFTSEVDSFNLKPQENDVDYKIYNVIGELSNLEFSKYQYSCTLLYRTLLEVATIKAYSTKRNELINDVKNLNGSIKALVDQRSVSLGKDEASVKKYIKDDIITIINNYIHHPRQVNTDLIFGSWVTMKEYIKACLT